MRLDGCSVFFGTVVVIFLLVFGGCAPVPVQVSRGEGIGGANGQLQSPPPANYARSVVDQRAEYRKSMAKEDRDAAYTFQKQGLLKQAVTKYRESLSWWPDPALEAYVESVEKAAGLSASGKKRPWTEAPRAPSKKYVTIATIRNRSNHDVHIFTAGGAETPETLFLPGEVREMAITPNAYGEVVFSASRGGRPVATAKWTGDPEDPRTVPVVLFDGGNPEKLVVMTGFRPR